MKKSILIGLLVLAAGLILAGCSSGASVNTWPGVTAGKDVAYLAYGQEIYAITPDKAAQSWKYPGTADNTKVFYSAPAVSEQDNLIVAGSWFPTKVNNKDKYGLYAIDLTGKDVWSQAFLQATGRWIASPVICGDKIFAANADQTIYVLDLKGNLITTYPKESYASDGGKNTKAYSKTAYWTQPVCNAANDTIYISSLNHYLYGFTLVDGSSLHLSTEISVKAALMASPVILENGNVLVGDINGNLYLVDTSAGLGKATSIKLQGGIWSKPLVSGSSVFIGTQDNNVYKLSEDLKIQAGPLPLDGPVMTQGIPTSDGVIFMTTTGTFWKIGLDGKLTSDTPLKQLAEESATGYLYSDAAVVGYESVVNGEIVEVHVIMAPITQGSSQLVTYDYDNKLPTLGFFTSK